MLQVNVSGIIRPCKKTPPASYNAQYIVPLLCVTMMVWAGMVSPVYAATAAIMSAQERTATVSALKKARNGQWDAAAADIAAIQHPLSLRIYQWLQYTNQKQASSFMEIAAFIRQNGGWPKQSDMRLVAELQLLKEVDQQPHIQSARSLSWFDSYAPMTAQGMALYLDHLHATGQLEKKHDILNKLWTSTLFSPEEQALFLRKYAADIDKKSHIHRISFLLSRSHYTNARVIASVIGDGYPHLVEARIALAEGKGGLDTLISRVPAHLEHDPGFVFERLQWRRKNNMDIGAMDILFAMPSADNIGNLPDWWRERHIMARRLIEKKQYDTAYRLVAAHQQKQGLPFAQAQFLAGFLALEFNNEPWRAFEHFEALFYGVSTPISKSRGAYWTARASDALGSPEIAQAWYKTAAQYTTTYYGQLALEHLKQQGALIDYKLPQRNLSEEAAFHAQDMVQAVNILHQSGFRKETTDFLYALSNRLEKTAEFIYLAELAAGIGHYHNAVYIGKRAQQRGFLLLDYAYPTLLNDIRPVPMDWALIHGLIRQESSFDIQAQSPAGARGLMQLMPATAKETAAKLGVAHQLPWLTERPSHNIRLGSAYLQQMLDRYNGSYPMALAAYNAGPGRVDRWIKEFGDPRIGEISYESWVELIPIYETRNYVQRVLESVYVYRIKIANLQPQAWPQPYHNFITVQRH